MKASTLGLLLLLAVGMSGCLLLLSALAAPLAAQPPFILWQRTKPDSVSEWSQYKHYTCVGDQNGDGCDDLMMTSYNINVRHWYSELFYGGFEMSVVPNRIFGPLITPTENTLRIFYIGDFFGDDSKALGIITVNADDPGNDSGYKIQLLRGGEELDTIPDYTLAWFENVGISRVYAITASNKTSDINGDGSDDLLVVCSYPHGQHYIYGYYGGEEPDTLADFSLYLGVGTGPSTISGYDLNGDNCDEIMKCAENTDDSILVFLGGDPPPDTAYFVIPSDLFSNPDSQFVITSASLLPDVNGDGYDDWCMDVHYFDEDWEENWFSYLCWQYLFLGGDSLTLIPHRIYTLDNHCGGTSLTKGGDINGDGYGDLLISTDADGERIIRICLGSPWVDAQHVYLIRGDPDLYPHMPSIRAYRNAWGDFDGDGISDIIVNCWAGRERLAILSGYDGWRFGVNEQEIPLLPEGFSFSVSPNPANSRVKLLFDLPFPGLLDVSIYTIEGRLLHELKPFYATSGSLDLPLAFDFPATGVYLIQSKLDGETQSLSFIQRVVYLK